MADDNLVMATGVDDIDAFFAYLDDPESDPALIFTIEERFGITFE